jgi:hypothetical protein
MFKKEIGREGKIQKRVISFSLLDVVLFLDCTLIPCTGYIFVYPIPPYCNRPEIRRPICSLTDMKI